MSSKTIKSTQASSESLSPKKKPAKMSLVEWQFALRRQFGQDNVFDVKNIGIKEVYSDFDIYNHSTDRHYKVAIRSQDNSLNFCTCNDFKTNGLSTCKHVEYVLHQIKNYPPYHKILLAGYQPDYSSIYLKYGAVREVMIKIGTLEKGKFEALAKKYFNKDYTLKPASYALIHELVKQAKQISSSFRIYDDAMEYLIERRETDQRHEKIAALFPDGITDGATKNVLKNPLADYHKQGALFLLKAGRAILADDFGLSHELQTLSACELFAAVLEVKKILILCPASLCQQWAAKIAQETYSTSKIYEPNTSNAWMAQPKHLYTIVSYQSLAQHVGSIQHLHPDLIVIDEAQRLKNWQLQLSENIKKITSKYAFVLAAPAIESQLEELYALMQFVDIFKLGPRYQFMADHQVTDADGLTTSYKNLHDIARMLQGVLLRRAYMQAMKLAPPLATEHILVPMTKAQNTIHHHHLGHLKKLVARWQTTRKLNETDRQQLLIHLQQMLKVSSNVYVTDQQTRSGTKISELLHLLEKAASLPQHKIVIFTHWESMARLVAQYLKDKNLDFQYLHSELPIKNREKIIAQYANAKSSSILLTTDAGSEAMRLPTSHIVFNLDLPVTPDLLAQRIAKVNASLLPLQIYTLVSCGSIEQKLLEIYHKKSTAQSFLYEGDNVIFLADSEFEQFMKTVERLADVEINLNQILFEDVAKETHRVGESVAATQLSFFENENNLSKAEAKVQPIIIGAKKEVQIEELIAGYKKYLQIEEATGELFLKIPLPNTEVLKGILGMLQEMEAKK